MVRQSPGEDVESVRATALAKGAEQVVVADCPTCAEGYFALARSLGATEDDIQGAIRAAEVRHAILLLNRRSFLKMTAAGAVAVGLGIAGHTVPLRAAARLDAGMQSAASTGAVWVHAYRSPLPGKDVPQTRLIGISGDGEVIATVDPLSGTPLRSADGNVVAIVTTGQDQRVEITVLDAQSGTRVRTISAKTLADSDGADSEITTALSADGRLLALVAHTVSIASGTSRTISKGGAYGVDAFQVNVGDQRSSLTVELLRLTDGASSGVMVLEDQSSLAGFVQPLFRQDGLQLLVTYVRDNQALLRLFSTTDMSLDEVDAGTLERAALPYGIPSVVTQPLRTRFLRNPGRVVSFINTEQVAVIDAGSLGTVRGIPVAPESWRRGEPTLIIAADGTEGYSVLPHGVAVQFVDLATAAALTLQVTSVAEAPVAPFASVPFNAVAYQPLSRRLLLSHSAAQGGISVIDIAAQSVSDEWIEDEPVAGVWSSADEQRVAALDASGALHLLDAQGAEVGTVPIGSALLRML